MSEMPKEIWVRPDVYCEGWFVLEDPSSVLVGDVKYLRADTIAETLDRAIEAMHVMAYAMNRGQKLTVEHYKRCNLALADLKELRGSK